MTKVISKQERLAAYEKVFGNVNGQASVRDSREMRVGKTEKDKANGHRPYAKNVRVWSATSSKNSTAGKTGEWVKR